MNPMNQPTPEEIAAKPRKALSTIFATGADGKIYEIPAATASEFVVTPERVKELGHLPILPYTKLLEPIAADEPEQELEEVGGRHKMILRSGRYGWHTDLQYGTYRWVSNGCYYTGFHAHIWNDVDAVDSDNL